MKPATVILVALIAILASAQAIFTLTEKIDLKNNLKAINNDLEKLNVENELLKADVSYFSRPENLVKELKKKFNYRKSDENLMIIVP